MLCTSPAFAQQLAVEAQGISLERLRLSKTRQGLIDVESGSVAPHFQWEASLWLGYANDPLVVYRASDRTRLGALVSDRFGGTLSGSVGLLERGEVSLELPLVLYQTRASDIPGALEPDTQLSPLSGTTVGDVRLLGKARVLNEPMHHLDLAFVLGLTVPTGGGRSYAGESGVTLAPELAVSRDFERVRLGGNLGAVIRPRTEVLNQVVESELTGHFGVGYRVFPRDGRMPPLEVQGALSTAVSAAQPFRNANQTHVEVRGMATYEATRALQLFLGSGVGLARGWGTPDFRFFFGARFLGAPPRAPSPAPAPAPAPRPVEPKPAPKPVVVVVKPPADRDGDGLIDERDTCPDEAEDKDQFKDDDGCPDPDNDQDGVADGADLCPLLAGPARNKGCPLTDTDGDSVFDLDDECPAVKGLVERKGCPDPDRDQDGIVDRLDNCPDEPGTPDNHGCAAKQLVVMSSERLEILQSVYFKLNKADIEPRSFALLDNVAAVLKSHPEVGKVLVEGHTDSKGNPVKNLDLSQRRAQSVLDYLVSKGVPAERLVAQGFGQTKPVAPNTTAAGREKNRRVVFTILGDGSKVQTGTADPTGETREAEPAPKAVLPKKKGSKKVQP